MNFGYSTLDSLCSRSGNPCFGSGNQSSKRVGQSVAIVRVHLSDLGTIYNAVCVFERR